MKTEKAKKSNELSGQPEYVRKEASFGLLKEGILFNGGKSSVSSAYHSIRIRKSFLSEVRKQSELKCDIGLYNWLLCVVTKQEFLAKGLYEGICPTMRIACDSKYLGFIPSVFVQCGRIVFNEKLHDVRLYISFDVTDFVKYILLADEHINGHVMHLAANEYSSYLLKTLKTKYPKRKFTQKFFRIYSFQYDEIRARMCEILSFYMEMISHKNVWLKGKKK